MQTMADATAIRNAVGRFLDEVLADPGLAHYWVGVDELRMRRHARLFVLQALGAPEPYSGDMRSVHRPLRIDEADFDRVAAMLIDCLSAAHVSADVLELGRRRVDDLRPVIVAA
jgi:hemoglobin